MLLASTHVLSPLSFSFTVTMTVASADCFTVFFYSKDDRIASAVGSWIVIRVVEEVQRGAHFKIQLLLDKVLFYQDNNPLTSGRSSDSQSRFVVTGSPAPVGPTQEPSLNTDQY